VSIKVFHFVLDPRVGGPHVYVRTLSHALGAEVCSRLVTAGQGPMTDIALVNLRHRLRALYPLEIVVNALALCWRFRTAESRRGVVFDVHGTANLAPILAARLLKIPLVWHFHETVGGFARLAAVGKRIAAGIPHRHVVVARKAADIFALPDAVLIPGAVDADFWRPSGEEGGTASEHAPFRILTVGNLNPLKGADILLDALETFDRPWELVIVGAELQTHAAYARGLHDHAAAIGSATRSVRFAGWQSPEDVRKLMAQTDVFVLPSRSEACPLALLEAMASGCACIATDVGDVGEILDGSTRGIVIPHDSPSALAEALERMAALGGLERRRIGMMAREFVTARHSLRQQAAKHLDLYKDLASSGERES